MAGFLLIMIALALFEVPSVVRNKMWRELVAFGVFWSFATIYGALLLADVTLPRPGALIINFLTR